MTGREAGAALARQRRIVAHVCAWGDKPFQGTPKARYGSAHCRQQD